MTRSILIAATLFAALTTAASAQDGALVGTWATAPTQALAKPSTDGKTDQTFREIVHVSVAGKQFTQITLSNEFGVEPLTIGAATVALRTTADTIDTPVPVTFEGGKPSTIIPPGKMVSSDLMNLKFPAMSDLAVSLFIPAQPMTMLTQHSGARATNYFAPGNQVNATSLVEAKTTTPWRYLRSMQIEEADFDGAVVCFGDSITDGSNSTANTNQRWPDLLAARLQGNKKTVDLGVLNLGIGGNRILHDVTGPSAVSRIDRDVLEQPGRVKYLVILEAINDIGHAADPVKPYDIVSADDLIAGYKYLITRAHLKGIKIIGATLTPYVGAKYSSPKGEAMRQALNQWIRTSKDLDGVIDFDKATRDPANPGAYLPAYDSGDHLHPNDAGMHAMADSIDLKLFEK